MMSMTGFASRTCMLEIPTVTVSITLSLKTVNGRYFEPTCRLPMSLTEIEPTCLRLLKQHLIRGTTVLTISMVPLAGKTNAQVTVNKPAVKAYAQALTDIAQEIQISYTPQIADLLTFPEIVQTQPESLDQALLSRIVGLVQELIQEVVKQRLQEGNNLRLDLQERIATIRHLWTSLKPIIDSIEQEERKKFAQLIETLPAAHNESTTQKLLESLASHLERMDVHEEYVRFTHHLEHMDTLLGSPDVEQGKRIDFVVQEMLREANTLNAKCHHTLISRTMVDIKVELEKMREQAQNIV